MADEKDKKPAENELGAQTSTEPKAEEKPQAKESKPELKAQQTEQTAPRLFREK